MRTGENSSAGIASAYDYLVIAIGSITNDFGTPGVAQNCLFLDDRVQADRFRNKLLNHCLRVSRALSENPAAEQFVRIAIVGGGATGVELAAELYNAASALRYYGLEVFDESRLKVTLIEAGARILPALPERLADAARDELEALGVRVMTATRVSECHSGMDRHAVGRNHRRRPEGVGRRRTRCRHPVQHRRPGEHGFLSAGGASDAADHARRAHLRHRRLLLLPAARLRSAGATARPGGAPDGEHGGRTTSIGCCAANRCAPTPMSIAARWCRSAAIRPWAA